VTDAALMLGVLEGRDEMDSTSVGIAGGVSRPAAEDLSGLVFGVPSALMGDGVEPGVKAVFEATLEKITSLGGRIEEVELPHAGHGISAYYVLAPAEASTNLSRYDGVRYGNRAPGTDLVDMYEQTRSAGFGPEVKRRIMLGTYALSSGYYDAYYGRAQRVRTMIVRDFDAAFAGVDFVITPTSPSVAFGLGEKTEDPWTMYLNDLFTVPMSLAGIPAISIPAGLAEPTGGGPQLPVGFQIAAPAFQEQKLLEAAFALEGAIAFDGSPGREEA
jgi:aspartyl-tRNA(Asn)/glutamyl-tRNA(Gln) amidotransferase subunit A